MRVWRSTWYAGISLRPLYKRRRYILTARLFIGIELPVQIKRLLNDVSESLNSRVESAKWVPYENLHLTLKFLGETPDAKIDDVALSLRRAVAEYRKFYFSLGQLGAFPNQRKARVLWLGVTHGTPELVAISKSIDNELINLGYEKEKRGFSPHITLARIKIPSSVENAISAVDPNVCQGRIVNVNSITLFESRLMPSGAEYAPLEHFNLNP